MPDPLELLLRLYRRHNEEREGRLERHRVTLVTAALAVLLGLLVCSAVHHVSRPIEAAPAGPHSVRPGAIQPGR